MYKKTTGGKTMIQIAPVNYRYYEKKPRLIEKIDKSSESQKTKKETK
jgi:hypothetical protein